MKSLSSSSKMRSLGSKSSLGQSRLGRSRLGQSTLGQSRLGKPRRDGLSKAPRTFRKFGRAFASAFRKGWSVLSGRRKKTRSLAGVGNVFNSKFGRGFGNIFRPRKSSGRGLTNVFKEAGLTRTLGAGARPEKGLAAASAGSGSGFSGGVFSSILGGEGPGLGLSLSNALSGGLPSLPAGPQPSDLVIIIRRYVQARVKGDASAYREARNRLRDQVGTLLADRILMWCNGEVAVPDDLTRVQGLENSKPQLRETIIWARAVLDDLTMRDGTRNRLDNAAVEEEAQREYEYVEETFGQQSPSRNRKRAGGGLGGRAVKSLATTAIKGTLGPFAIPLLLFSSAVDRWADRRDR